LGLIIAGIGQLIMLTSYQVTGDVIRFIGFAITIDDLIQHIWQGIYLHNVIKQSKKIKHITIKSRKISIADNSGIYHRYLPAFLIHTLLYKYWKINKWQWVNKITNFMNKLFGA